MSKKVIDLMSKKEGWVCLSKGGESFSVNIEERLEEIIKEDESIIFVHKVYDQEFFWSIFDLHKNSFYEPDADAETITRKIFEICIIDSNKHSELCQIKTQIAELMSDAPSPSVESTVEPSEGLDIGSRLQDSFLHDLSCSEESLSEEHEPEVEEPRVQKRKLDQVNSIDKEETKQTQYQFTDLIQYFDIFFQDWLNGRIQEDLNFVPTKPAHYKSYENCNGLVPKMTFLRMFKSWMKVHSNYSRKISNGYFFTTMTKYFKENYSSKSPIKKKCTKGKSIFFLDFHSVINK